MTPGPRGWIVLLALVALAVLAGWSTGRDQADKKWERWTYAHVAWEAKGDRE